MNAATETVAVLNPSAQTLAAMAEWGITISVSGSGYGPRVHFVKCDKTTAREMRAELGHTFASVQDAHLAANSDNDDSVRSWAPAAAPTTAEPAGWDR